MYIVNVSVLITNVTHDPDPPQLYHIIISHYKCTKYGLCSDDRSHMDNKTRYIVNVNVKNMGYVPMITHTWITRLGTL
jgi:hypothetical protein